MDNDTVSSWIIKHRKNFLHGLKTRAFHAKYANGELQYSLSRDLGRYLGNITSAVGYAKNDLEVGILQSHLEDLVIGGERAMEYRTAALDAFDNAQETGTANEFAVNFAKKIHRCASEIVIAWENIYDSIRKN